MRKNNDRKITNNKNEKDIQLNKSEKILFKEKNKPVRKIANVVTTEFSPVDEQLEETPKH